MGESPEEDKRKGGRRGVGRRKLEAGEPAGAGCLSGRYPGVGSSAELGGTLSGRLSSGGSGHSQAAPPN